VGTLPKMPKGDDLYRLLTLTRAPSGGSHRLSRYEGHPPGVVADIARCERDGKARLAELLLDLVLAVALQTHARAQLAIVGKRGRDQPDQRVLQKAVPVSELQQRQHVAEHADFRAQDVAEHEAAGRLQDPLDGGEGGV